MDDFVDVVVVNKSIVTVVCEVGDIGKWIDRFYQKDFYLESVRPHEAADGWVLNAARNWSLEERW